MPGRFEIESLYVGVHALVINYRNQAGGLVNEVLLFAGDLVAEGHGTYLADGARHAGQHAMQDSWSTWRSSNT